MGDKQNDYPSHISTTYFISHLCMYSVLLHIFAMADLMWGGVPFTIPSSTAMKYLSGAVKVKVGQSFTLCIPLLTCFSSFRGNVIYLQADTTTLEKQWKGR